MTKKTNTHKLKSLQGRESTLSSPTRKRRKTTKTTRGKRNNKGQREFSSEFSNFFFFSLPSFLPLLLTILSSVSLDPLSLSNQAIKLNEKQTHEHYWGRGPKLHAFRRLALFFLLLQKRINRASFAAKKDR
jgi:hypothetical protein